MHTHLYMRSRKKKENTINKTETLFLTQTCFPSSITPPPLSPSLQIAPPAPPNPPPEIEFTPFNTAPPALKNGKVNDPMRFEGDEGEGETCLEEPSEGVEAENDRIGLVGPVRGDDLG